ncbi:uncharacterized protein VDAG_09577 [Verticillium dahliae VdLs.17]|uniref:Xylanolytic transcriptional activator regulatory domain-containing protein n=1 Tax=Verticillium dahliae (strain VdLs.17 / ATCC MYA-4575 / FGSC 10137) TaxID=498257 RepID=G2XHS7_VERDV|nr:uncharacterized protein VDAG_09577 [Verticillium dahliae VdLs.17]EGY19375.1 hypothetical protein VDAG_09577 [Verticillium dahliae VdLs.17]
MCLLRLPFDGGPKPKVWSPALGLRRFADSAKVPEPDVSSSVPPSGRSPDTGDLSPMSRLIEKLDNIIVERLSLTRPSPWTRIQFMKPPKGPQVTPDEARDYIRAYFENLHPVYPFLDRDIFETKALSPQLPHVLDQNPIFSALYHAVLALGSQFFRQGTYSPGTGKSWELFQVSLGHMAEIILPRESLENVQAITAMIDDALVAHAARMAIVLRYHRSSAAQSDQARVFWVIYALEKQQCLLSRCSSMIPDEDIACPAPSAPESIVGAYNAFLTFVRIGRISSVAYQSLFSISAAQKSAPALQAAILHMRGLLEEWRMGIPAAFRPCEPANFDALTDASTRLAVLQTHYLYLGLIISIERLTLHLDKERGAASQRSRVNLMNAARTIVDLSRYIELEPYVPVAITCIMPLTALFILFDFIIHNPLHRETRANLTLLDTIAGYFSMIDFASKGALPGRVIPEFAQIAREYFIKVQTQGITEAERASDAKDDALGPKESPATRDKAGEPSTEMQQDNPAAEESWANAVGSDYLSYPTPANFEVPTDMQMWDAGDFRSIFGTAFPEWAMGPDVALGSLGLTDGGR